MNTFENYKEKASFIGAMGEIFNAGLSGLRILYDIRLANMKLRNELPESDFSRIVDYICKKNGYLKDIKNEKEGDCGRDAGKKEEAWLKEALKNEKVKIATNAIDSGYSVEMVQDITGLDGPTINRIRLKGVNLQEYVFDNRYFRLLYQSPVFRPYCISEDSAAGGYTNADLDVRQIFNDHKDYMAEGTNLLILVKRIRYGKNKYFVIGHPYYLHDGINNFTFAFRNHIQTA
jgi:hypothetical protein